MMMMMMMIIIIIIIIAKPRKIMPRPVRHPTPSFGGGHVGLL